MLKRFVVVLPEQLLLHFCASLIPLIWSSESFYSQNLAMQAVAAGVPLTHISMIAWLIWYLVKILIQFPLENFYTAVFHL